MREPQIVPSTPGHLTKIEMDTTIVPIPLNEYLEVVVRHRLLIAAVALTVSVGGAVYAYSKPPLYEGNFLVSVPDVRVAEQRDLLGSPAFSLDRKTTMSEAEILRSRVILEPVVEKLHLDVSASPTYMPIIGRAVAALTGGRLGSGAALAGYSWGNEKIIVNKFDVPQHLVGSAFLITKISDNRFLLEQKNAGISVAGQVGEELRVGSLNAAVRLKIDSLRGGVGARFLLTKNARVTALESLQNSLSISELGKDSGMLRVAFSDSDPENIKLVLNGIANTYVKFLRDQKISQSAVSLGVLQAQLPILKKRVELAETSYEDFRRANGTSDLAEETKLKLGRFSMTKAQVADLRQKRAEMGTRLGNEHPLVVAMDQQIRMAEREASAVASEIRNVPTISKELERRSRNLQTETEIYNSVSRKIEEMSVVSQDPSTSVKVVDEALVPVTPKNSRATVAAIFTVFGILLGIFSAFLRKMFSRSNTSV